MTRAWVADEGQDWGFEAHVEFDLDGPFSALQGPYHVSLEEALGWARAQADRVSVRVGNVHYSAGREPIRSLPVWTGADPQPRPVERQGELRCFKAEASTGWYRDDRAEVARTLAEAIAHQNGVLGSSYELREHRAFKVAFVVESPSLLAAQEDCFNVICAAWTACGIEARPGDDYDISSLQVTPASSG